MPRWTDTLLAASCGGRVDRIRSCDSGIAEFGEAANSVVVLRRLAQQRMARSKRHDRRLRDAALSPWYVLLLIAIPMVLQLSALLLSSAAFVLGIASAARNYSGIHRLGPSTEQDALAPARRTI
jgi:hypothetical protein